jgi:hypothetical protein
MRLLSLTKSFFRCLFQRRQADADLDAEMRSTVELLADQKIREGMTPEQATRAAKIELGGVEQVKEGVREARIGAWVETLLQDLRFGLRMLRKSPGFTAVAVLTLALGIGATTAIFSLVDVVLFRPLPIAHPDEIVRVTGGDAQDISRFVSMSFPAYLELRDRASAFSSMAADIDRLPVNFSSAVAGSERVGAGMVTGNYFGTLGVAMISDEFWRSDFSRSANVLGSTAMIDGRQCTIIGVTPSGFGGVTFDNFPRVWLPATLGFEIDPLLKTQMPLHRQSFAPFTVFARLKGGVPIQSAQAQLDSIAATLGAGKPVPGEYGVV